MFRTKVSGKIRKHVLGSVIFFFLLKSCREVMLKDMVKPDSPQITIQDRHKFGVFKIYFFFFHHNNGYTNANALLSYACLVTVRNYFRFGNHAHSTWYVWRIHRFQLWFPYVICKVFWTIHNKFISLSQFTIYISNTGLFEMIVGVFTIRHTQYTWDRSIYVFYLIEQHSKFLLQTLQVLYMFY